jgi:hypothetical protein
LYWTPRRRLISPFMMCRGTLSSILPWVARGQITSTRRRCSPSRRGLTTCA